MQRVTGNSCLCPSVSRLAAMARYSVKRILPAEAAAVRLNEFIFRLYGTVLSRSPRFSK